EIAAGAGRKRLSAEHAVDKRQRLVRQAEAEGVAALHERRRQATPAAEAGIGGAFAGEAVGRAGDGLELAPRAGARIQPAVFEQPADRFFVQRDPLALPVRAVRPPDVRPFVPVEAEPAQIVEERRLILGLAAVPVDVFDAQHENAAGLAHMQPGDQCGEGVAVVETARRRWRIAAAFHGMPSSRRADAGPASGTCARQKRAGALHPALVTLSFYHGQKTGDKKRQAESLLEACAERIWRTMTFKRPRPIDGQLPELAKTVRTRETTLLVAPPGAGKSTRVPLGLLREPWLGGRKIVLLEPRRVAARAVARRMADELDEPVGRTVGYRMQGDTRVGPDTRIE